LSDDLITLAREARTWLFDCAAPLWSGAGLQKNGMFAERFDAAGCPDDVPLRLRVQARQIYTYCELGRLGWRGPWRNVAKGALDILLARGRRRDGFFVHTFTPDGQPLDTRADLYDHAFTLFCLGHAADALNRPDLLDDAAEIFALLESRWRHPRGGFLEGEIDGPPRRQNPHMHLLEAAIVLYRISGEKRWGNVIDELVTLCRQHFVDPATGALTEYFASDWTRLDSAEGLLVEPGHCFEWAWLFEALVEHGYRDTPLSDRLTKFARRYGLAASGCVAIDSVSLNGEILNAEARLWPQAERLKIALARWRRTGEEEEYKEAVVAFRGLNLYFATPIQGCWYDKRRLDGSFAEEPVRASSFYHIVCALSELFRTANI